MAKRAKKMTAGAKIAKWLDPEGTIGAAIWRAKVARRIDAAIRKAAWEGYDAGRVNVLIFSHEEAEAAPVNLAAKYGPRPKQKGAARGK